MVADSKDDWPLTPIGGLRTRGSNQIPKEEVVNHAKLVSNAYWNTGSNQSGAEHLALIP
jgi:hypothetical protein